METIAANKIALTSFDNKRYIKNDKVSTLPFGHYSIRDEVFEKMILDDSSWGEEDVSESPEHNLVALERNYNWNEPDMGFMQREYTESELGNVVDFDQLSLMSDQEEELEDRNPFIEFEAEEVSEEEQNSEEDETLQRKKAGRKRRHFVIDSD